MYYLLLNDFDNAYTSSANMTFRTTQSITIKSLTFKAESNYRTTVGGVSTQQEVSMGLYINGTLVATTNVRSLATYVFSNFEYTTSILSDTSISIRTTDSRGYYIYRGTSSDNYNANGIAFASTNYYQCTIGYEADSIWIMNNYPALIGSPDLTILTEMKVPKSWAVWKITEGINDGYPYIWGFALPPSPPKYSLYVCEGGILKPLTVWLNGYRRDIYIK